MATILPPYDVLCGDRPMIVLYATGLIRVGLRLTDSICLPARNRSAGLTSAQAHENPRVSRRSSGVDRGDLVSLEV